MQPPLHETLTADGATGWYKVEGTVCQMILDGESGGGFGGGSVAVEIKTPDGNAVSLTDDANTALSYNVSQAVNFELPAGTEVRASLSGSTSPQLAVTFKTVSDGRFQY